MFLNEDEWFVMAPHRYAGESAGPITVESIPGTYSYVDHGRDISSTVKNSEIVTLSRDGTITGAVTGTWEKRDDYGIRITIGGEIYNGVLLRQWDSGLKRTVMAVSVMSVSKGNSLWMSQLEPEVDLKNTSVYKQRAALYLTIRIGKASFFLERASEVQIIAYDLSGRIAGTLWSGYGTAGHNEVTLSTVPLKPGAYLFTLQYYGNSSISRHIVYLSE